MTTGIVIHPVYLRHEQHPSHPERRERLAYTMDQLTEEGVFERPDIRVIEPVTATRADILAVHEEQYLSFLEAADSRGAILDMDTVLPPGGLADAFLAAGGGISACSAVISGEVENAFAMVRPPGHHAGRGHGGGFCYLNNIAILARFALRSGFRRVLILDWDAHHGNGTQEIFWEDNSVLFMSIHQMPLYPGSGRTGEAGGGEGSGYTINMPVPPGASDDCYSWLMGNIIVPVAHQFHPDIILVSAGQDNHYTDPLTGLALTAGGYADLMGEARQLARTLCGGRIVVVLEGGYSVEGGLPYTNLGIIAALAGWDRSAIREPALYQDLLDRSRDPGALATVQAMARDLSRVHSNTWQMS